MFESKSRFEKLALNL